MQWAKQKQAGFTIVELLIVVVVIAILAAITIVAYNGIQARALESSLQTDLRNAMVKFQNYKAIETTYPLNDDASLDKAGIQANQSLYAKDSGNFLYCGNNTSGLTDVAIIVRATNGKTYAMATNRVFGEYTAFGIGDYSSACSNLVGTSNARYGYTGSVWRSWVKV